MTLNLEDHSIQHEQYWNVYDAYNQAKTSISFDEAKTEIASNEVIEKSNAEETKPALDNKEKPNLMKKWLDKLNLKKAEWG